MVVVGRTMFGAGRSFLVAGVAGREDFQSRVCIGPAKPTRVEWQARAHAELRRGEGAVQVTRQGPGGAPRREARVLQAYYK